MKILQYEMKWRETCVVQGKIHIKETVGLEKWSIFDMRLRI